MTYETIAAEFAEAEKSPTTIGLGPSLDAATHTWAYPATRDIVAVTDPERW